jgi:hypothetical protein
MGLCSSSVAPVAAASPLVRRTAVEEEVFAPQTNPDVRDAASPRVVVLPLTPSPPTPVEFAPRRLLPIPGDALSPNAKVEQRNKQLTPSPNRSSFVSFAYTSPSPPAADGEDESGGAPTTNPESSRLPAEATHLLDPSTSPNHPISTTARQGLEEESAGLTDDVGPDAHVQSLPIGMRGSGGLSYIEYRNAIEGTVSHTPSQTSMVLAAGGWAAATIATTRSDNS